MIELVLRRSNGLEFHLEPLFKPFASNDGTGDNRKVYYA